MPEPDFDQTAFLKTLTSRPGVYRMLDGEGGVLYVGKARNLKKRVATYFRDPARLAGKQGALMRHTRSVEVTVTQTESEALLLENDLIKAHLPRYNILLRDDKSYPYIYVSSGEPFPRLAFHRGARRGKGRYFGPFPGAGAVRETLGLLQKLFQVRQCEDNFFSNRTRACLQYQIKRCTGPCVGLVSERDYETDVRHTVMFLESKSGAVVEELVSRMEEASRALDFELAARYRDQIASLRRVQAHQHVTAEAGDMDIVAVACRDGLAVVEMLFVRGGRLLGNKALFPKHAADADVSEVLSAFLPQYYLATGVERDVPREILINAPIASAMPLAAALSQVMDRKVAVVHHVRGDRARWLKMAERNAEVALAQRLLSHSTMHGRLEALVEALDLEEIPQRIECFDVSHTRGEATVAACVVFGPEGPLKSDYRRFNVDGIAAGDDYGAMRQVLERRYTRLRREEGRVADLLLVDGGRGQVSQAVEVLRELQVPGVLVCGVAKGPARKAGLERLVLPHRKSPLILAPDSDALHLIQQIRDEAHRFAVLGHRAKRGRSRKTSTLEGIPGVGAKRRQRLLSEFGGLQGVARAGVDELARVKGVSPVVAQAIYDAFHEA